MMNAMRFNFGQQHTESPLFERHVNNDEYEELQQCKVLIDNMQQRLYKLEKINLDLEYRLEDQAKQTMAVESECLKLESRWKEHSEELHKEIDAWKAAYESEQTKGARLREHLSRTEKELYGILQRKYEFMRGGPQGGKGIPGGKGGIGNGEMGGLRGGPSEGWDINGDIMSEQSNESKRAKEKRILHSMTDFFGF